MHFMLDLSGDGWRSLLERWRTSRKPLLVIVFIALFLDNMLLTTVGKYRNSVNQEISSFLLNPSHISNEGLYKTMQTLHSYKTSEIMNFQ